MAEIAGLGLEIIKCIWSPTCNYLDRHRNFEEDVNEMRRILEDLNRRKEDIELRKQGQLIGSGKVVKLEVQSWLEQVQNINAEVEAVLEKVQEVKWRSRARLAKLVRRKVGMVKDIHDRGSFPEALVTDGPSATGIALPTEKLVGEISTKQKIWQHLMGKEVGMIGVCGIGGVGKTTVMKHINNDLLKGDRFQKVIWVTVSYPLNVIKLQENIASSIGVRLPEGEDELMRAAALKQFMEEKYQKEETKTEEVEDILGDTYKIEIKDNKIKWKFVLILDDVWEMFRLERVGILKPTKKNGCKVVITSRSIDVCKYLGCEIVKVSPLSPEESLNLFRDNVGDLKTNPDLEAILKQVVEECAGLPLAIVVIAGSMKGENDICEWRNALNELRECINTLKPMEDDIFRRLRFSYERLKSLTIQNCFLCCSLYPEDYQISREDLIERWMDEGIIEEFGSRQAMYDRGCAIINRLENNCLLEKGFQETCVKMHDVLRDTALRIKGGSRFMVKAGLELKEIPGESDWTEDLEKVSLMENKILAIPLGMCPKCPTLSTLILKRNHLLERIPESFFEQMPELKVLDFSYTSIAVLPNSISNLENLITLNVHCCESLAYVPSLAKLKALKKLDLFLTAIEKVPQGIEMLISLKFLNLYCPALKELSMEVLHDLTCLQYLVMYLESTRIKEEEVARLRLNKLETFEVQFSDIQTLSFFCKSEHFQRLPNYLLVVGSRNSVFQNSRSGCHKWVILTDCQIGDDAVLPNNPDRLEIDGCNGMRSLTSIDLVGNKTEFCAIRNCGNIECVLDMVSTPSLCVPLLDMLQELVLEELDNLHAIVRVEASAAATQILPGIFSNLKKITVTKCFKIKKLFPQELLQSLQNLEVIIVGKCPRLEEIIAWEVEKVENDPAQGGDAFVELTIPKLTRLELSFLPKLKSICSARVMVCDYLESVTLCGCPKLKRFPLCCSVSDDGKLSHPLREIWTDQSRLWWESLDWDNQDRTIFLPLLHYVFPIRDMGMNLLS